MKSSTYGGSTLVREAEPEEWDSVVALTLAAYEQYATSADPAFWRQYQENIKTTITSSIDVIRLVAVRDSEIVASAIYCLPCERTFGDRVVFNPYPEMRLLSVSPKYRNLGLGALLIDECERRALGGSFEAITLHTTNLMTVARSMYERRGYKRFEQIDFEPAPGFHVWGYLKGMNIK